MARAPTEMETLPKNGGQLPRRRGPRGGHSVLLALLIVAGTAGFLVSTAPASTSGPRDLTLLLLVICAIGVLFVLPVMIALWQFSKRRARRDEEELE